MVEWWLTICTAALLGCGHIAEHKYPSEQSCYKALEELYKRQGPEKFLWVTCSTTKFKKEKNNG